MPIPLVATDQFIDFSQGDLTLSERYRWRELHEYCEAATIVPTRAQYDLNQEIGNCVESKKKIFLVTSANGTGKTTGMLNILANLFWNGINVYPYAMDMSTGEEFDGFYHQPLFKKGWPPRWPKVVWVIAHIEGQKTILEQIQKWWPKDKYSYKEFKDGKNATARIITSTGWLILFKTTNMEARAFESANVGIVWCDEPPKQWQFNACISRLRRGGIMVITATPIFEAGWFVDTIVEKIDTEVAGRGWSDKFHQTVHLHTNSQEHAGHWFLGLYGYQFKGKLAPEDVQFIKDNTDPEEYPARIEGKFVHLSGLVYKSYAQEINVRRLDWPEPRDWYMYRMIVDPHSRIPPAVCWERLDPSRQHYAFREWPSTEDHQFHGKLFHLIKDALHYKLEDFITAFIEIEEEWRIPLNRIKRIMDPNFAKVRQIESGLPLNRLWTRVSKRIYAERGYPEGTAMRFITNVKDDITTGHSHVKQALKNDPETGPIEIIDPRCKNIELSYRRYRWRDHQGTRSEWDTPSEALEQNFKHFMDLRRYTHALRFTYEPLPTYRPSMKSDYQETKDIVHGGSSNWKARFMRDRPEGADGV